MFIQTLKHVLNRLNILFVNYISILVLYYFQQLRQDLKTWIKVTWKSNEKSKYVHRSMIKIIITTKLFFPSYCDFNWSPVMQLLLAILVTVALTRYDCDPLQQCFTVAGKIARFFELLSN